ncbi:MAG: non-canonical purine NTP pyrophosphatase [Proteobacteria bacterium]|nr:non-canonical purine NTP pyrophosphatase [Pseudomonadota bacterium]
MQCFVATGNSGKLKEIVELGKFFFPQITEWIGQAPKNAEEIENTFIGNAQIKSRALFHEVKMQSIQEFWVLADDSGIEVDSLGGRPGVLSARYAGDHVEPVEHIKKLISELGTSPNRGAQYHCALSLIVFESHKIFEYEAEGVCRGEIIKDGRGASGFGYDPIFYVPEFKKTMAELDVEIKNSISHRYKAFEDLSAKIARIKA